MLEQTFDGHLDRPVVLDLCFPCQSFWFDPRESVSLTPGATLTLFGLIGEHVNRPRPASHEAAKCPRCRGRLRLTHDMQRATRFQYLRCPNGHGRLTTFFDFLREKDFVRPLTPQQVATLREQVQSVNCSNCGGPIDLARGSVCLHCGSALSMLDMKQAGALIAQLRNADRTDRPIDPALPLELARARRQVEEAFAFERETDWFKDASAADLVGAGLNAVARWLKRHA